MTSPGHPDPPPGPRVPQSHEHIGCPLRKRPWCCGGNQSEHFVDGGMMTPRGTHHWLRSYTAEHVSPPLPTVPLRPPKRSETHSLRHLQSEHMPALSCIYLHHFWLCVRQQSVVPRCLRLKVSHTAAGPQRCEANIKRLRQASVLGTWIAA